MCVMQKVVKLSPSGDSPFVGLLHSQKSVDSANIPSWWKKPIPKSFHLTIFEEGKKPYDIIDGVEYDH